MTSTPIVDPPPGRTNWPTLVAEPNAKPVCAVCQCPLDCRDHAFCWLFREPIDGYKDER
jgi:hypothetical protein